MGLSKGQVHLWHVNLNDFADINSLEPCLEWLDARELAKYRRYRLARHRQQYLLGRALIRSTLSRYAPCAPGDWHLVQGEEGKPMIAPDSRSAKGAGSLFFNLSHSGNAMLLAVCAREQVGIDVESCDRPRRISRIAHRYFSPVEVAALMALPDEEQLRRFYTLWTLKEAYIKARGLGLKLPLGEFSFEFPDADQISLTLSEAIGDVSAPWQLWQFASFDNIQAALAVRVEDGVELSVQHWRLRALDVVEPHELEVRRQKAAQPKTSNGV